MPQEIVYEVPDHEAAPEARKIHGKMFELVQRLRPRSVLEIGCGTGLLGSRIDKSGVTYCGIEPVEAQFRICRERFPQLDVRLASCYDEPNELQLGSFDMVISSDVIEHLYAPRKLVDFAKRHLNASGKVVTCTPDFGSYWKNMAYSFAGKWDLVHSPTWDGGHIKFFSRRTLQRLFEEGGFEGFSWDHVRNINLPIFKMSIICTCSAAREPSQRGQP